MAFPTGWTKRTAITIPAAQVGSGGVSSFTALFTQASINAASQTDLFANANTDGSDIRVSTDSAGTNLLTVDVIAYDDTAETFVIRVGTLTLSAVTANTLYLWWGNASATSQTGSGAYDADWLAYVPFTDAEIDDAAQDFITDRTGNGNTFSSADGAITKSDLVSGKGTRAIDFATVSGGTGSAHFENAGGILSGLDELTAMVWVNNNPAYDDGRSIEYLGTTGFLLWPDNANGPDTIFGATANRASMGSMPTGPILLAATMENPVGSNFLRLYVNGTLEATDTTGEVSLPVSTTDVCAIGASPGGTNRSNDQLSDAQFHRVPRSAAWITTEYNQTNAPASFASSGDPVAVGAPSVRRRARWAA